jgi:hypothetical protein
MAQGPILIFDKSSLESLNLDEAVLLDNFYRSNITPLFFVECLADLEKAIKSRSTTEQLVGSLATRTPEAQACANIHHESILQGELTQQFDLTTFSERPLLGGGRPVQLGDKKGIIFQRSPEEEALERWSHREFLQVERSFAKNWRNSILRINHNDLVKTVIAGIGHWRKPTSLADAKQMADYIIDNMDPEWLIGFAIELFDVPDPQRAIPWVRKDWASKRKPRIRQYLPYLTHMLSINIFFTLVIQTQLLRDVKPSHQIDLAYLYYLPFCSVFTSKDRFHVQVAPLFMTEHQTFVNGIQLKEDLQKLDQHYSSMPDEVRKQGLWTFALVPPEDTDFLITQLWDKYLPLWRTHKDMPNLDTPEQQQKLIEEINKFADDENPEVVSHDEHDVSKLDHVTIKRSVLARKGKWRRFSEEQERSVNESQKGKLS